MSMPRFSDYAPAWVWALLCLALAAYYAVKWPKAKAGTDRRGFRYLVLRWFHSLVWVALAAAVWLHATDAPSLQSPARVLALSALALYVVFAAVLLAPKRAGGDV